MRREFAGKTEFENFSEIFSFLVKAKYQNMFCNCTYPLCSITGKPVLSDQSIDLALVGLFNDIVRKDSIEDSCEVNNLWHWCLYWPYVNPSVQLSPTWASFRCISACSSAVFYKLTISYKHNTSPCKERMFLNNYFVFDSVYKNVFCINEVYPISNFQIYHNELVPIPDSAGFVIS